MGCSKMAGKGSASGWESQTMGCSKAGGPEKGVQQGGRARQWGAARGPSLSESKWPGRWESSATDTANTSPYVTLQVPFWHLQALPPHPSPILTSPLVTTAARHACAELKVLQPAAARRLTLSGRRGSGWADNLNGLQAPSVFLKHRGVAGDGSQG